jgi:diguanylate cyclase (GGDEF)-like protein/PAS domain S-box-containing protein
MPEDAVCERRPVPLRALLVSLAAFVVAAVLALGGSRAPPLYDTYSWLLLLVPAFVLAYYCRWPAAAWMIGIGAALILALQWAGRLVLGTPLDSSYPLWAAAALVMLALGVGMVGRRLERERRDALVLAYTDPLTGLPNRRLLDFMLTKEFAAAQRGRPLSVVLFDVDGFGRYNERYGRSAGDFALRRIADALDQHMRLMNVGGRYGPDSFLAILSGEKVDGAWVFAERTRQAIADLEMGPGGGATVSVGVASYELWMRESAELLEAVGRALDRARRHGGNRVVCETTAEEEWELPRDLAALPPEMQAAFEHAWRRQAVEDAEVRFRKLFDGVPVGLYRATPEGEILDANSALVRILGYPDRQSLIRVNAGELYADPEDRKRWQERLKKEGLVRDFEVRLRRYDGTVIWGRDTARAVRGRDGVVRYYTGVLEDITERKRAEEELREANEKLRAVFDAAPVALISLDRAGRVLSWNRAAEEIFGWSEEEVVSRAPPFVSDEHEDEFALLLDRVKRGEALLGVEVRRQRRDGTPVDLNIYAAPLFGSDGSVMGIMGMVVDVTERRELEARLLQSQKMESIGRLAGGVAHDFNNLLTVILGNCELVLADLPEGDPRRGDVEDIRSAAEHAAALTRQLLAFSRRQILQPKVLSLNTVVKEMLEMLGRIIGEDIELVTELDPSLANTLADPVEMGQVIMNLAVNARDAMPDGGRLFIKTANVFLARDALALAERVPAGGYVALSVTDTGVGMDSETASRIFEPFFTTKEAGRGTGLGLSTVYGIVKQSGGYISVESEPGQGTTFTIYLPRYQEAVAGGTEGQGEPGPPKADPPPAGDVGGTILLVEDEPGLRESIRRGLEREGFRVLEARDAAEALKVCAGHAGDIDVLVTDVALPGMDGPELGRRVVEARPGVKVLYTSGYAASLAGREGVAAPGDFLQKPYTPSDLGKKIRELLA